MSAATPPTDQPAVKVVPTTFGGNLLGFLPLRDFFSLDLRSLALFRIAIAFVLLLDWIDRLPDLEAHYSDSGIFTADSITFLQPFSLHVFHGSVWFQAILAGLAIFFCLTMMVGWWTPLSTLMCWFLLISVHSRCPPVIQGGDQLLRMLLFWGIFLPLGACYSLDSARPDSPPPRPGKRGYQVLTCATVAYIVQMCIVYWYAATWKWAPEWRDDGTAVYLAMKADYFTTRFAHFMLGYPEILRYLTFSTLWLEALGPALLFFPFAPSFQRMLVVSAFILFHAGLSISLELGNFPWVCCSAWLAFLPSSFWDRLWSQLRTPEAAGLTFYYDTERPRAGALVARLRTFLFLGEARLVPAEKADDHLPEVRRGGWVVVDEQGKEHHGSEALEFLLRLSPLARLLHFAPIRWTAERLLRPGYALIAVPQEPAEPPAGVPSVRTPRWMPPSGLIANTLVLFFIVYVALWNIRSYFLGKIEWSTAPQPQTEDRTRWLFPPQAAQLGMVLGIEQGWGLFAPRPGKILGWELAVGTTKDGRTIDLLRDGLAVDPKDLGKDKPELLASCYGNCRWRKLLMNLPAVNAFPYLAPGLARYEMKKWNATHSGGDHVTSVEVIYIRQENEPPDKQDTKTPDQVIVVAKYTEPQEDGGEGK
jgi:hypothetical protein